MAKKETAVEYMYRYRSWDKNVWYGVRHDDPTAEQIEAGWGEWEWIDEQKYNEILAYIAWDRPCHYQAEKVMLTVMYHDSFDPVEYIAKEKASFAQHREEERAQRAQPASVSSFSAPQSSAPVIDGYGLLNLVEGVARTVGNAISSTASGAVDVAGDCVSAIGEGISGMCE